PRIVCFSHSPATPYISPLSLHDALPIYAAMTQRRAEQRLVALALRRMVARRLKMAVPGLDLRDVASRVGQLGVNDLGAGGAQPRSEEHTSELQSLTNLVCRLLLEKKKHP